MSSDYHIPSIRAVCWSIVVFVSLVVAVGILILAPRMAPIRPGDSHVFWKLACRVSLSPEVDDARSGTAYFVDDRWAAYDSYHLHGSDVYYISASDASSEFDAVVEALDRARERGEDDPFVRGYVNWQADDEYSRDPPGLLAAIKRSRRKDWIERDIDLLIVSIVREQQFWQRWQRARWYWANMVFEWTFLSGLVVFALWPGIRARSAWNWAIRWAFLPVLFLLPVYLGYAVFTFTSAGPSGGVLYPFLLRWCRGGSVTALDGWVLDHLPQVLEPLSTPIGSPMVLSGGGMPGPTTAIIVGVLVGGLIVGINAACRQSREGSCAPHS